MHLEADHDAGPTNSLMLSGISNAPSLTSQPASSPIARMLAQENLAPDIVTAVFNGTSPKNLTVAKLANGIPDDWQEQRRIFGMA